MAGVAVIVSIPEVKVKSSTVYSRKIAWTWEKNDLITLIFDCDNRRISIVSQRTNAKHEMAVDTDSCQFPWQLHVILKEPKEPCSYFNDVADHIQQNSSKKKDEFFRLVFYLFVPFF